MTQRNVCEERRWAAYHPKTESVTWVAPRWVKKSVAAPRVGHNEILVRVTILVPTKEKT